MKMFPQRRDTPLEHIPPGATGIAATYPIHATRGEADPLYRVLCNRDEAFLDVLLQNARAILEKRYGPDFQSSRWILRMWDLLAQYNDFVIKVFVFNFTLQREPLFARAVSELYNIKEKNALFCGNRGPQQLFLYIHHFLTAAMEAHLNHHNNKYTIVPEMDHHLQQACREYVMGPFNLPARKR